MKTLPKPVGYKKIKNSNKHVEYIADITVNTVELKALIP